jgi:nicotinamide-nucleotide amidase
VRAEIIAVGTELLMGDVINSNAAWLSKELATLGVDVFYHHTVGDNPERIQGVLKKALERAEFIIFTGGLGPTDDDLTVATLADYFKVSMVEDADSVEKIKNYFIARDMPMSKLNLKQALKPTDAITIQNPVGTAPGILWDVSEKVGKQTVLMTFPGVPKELYAMWPQGKDAIRQAMKAAGLENQILVTSFLKFFGIGESKLAEILRDLMQSPSPTVAPYVGEAEVKIRVSCKGLSEDEARKEMQPVKEEIIRRCKPYFFGEDEETLPSCVGKLLTERKQRVSIAESCTGGLVSSRLTDVPGSSRYVHYNVVTYANEQKTARLSVPAHLFESVGAVSEEVAEAMAIGMLKKSQSDWAISLTGIAGPDGGTDEKPIGLVYIGLAHLDEGQARVCVKKMLVNQKYKRADIKYWFSQYALFYLKQAMCGEIPEQEWHAVLLEPEAEYTNA